MNTARSRVILAGYSPDLPDLVSVRALDRALASGLIIAPHDLPRDLGNRATIWIDEEIPLRESDDAWAQMTHTLGQGKTVLRWYPDNPLATATGRLDATDLSEAGIPIELVPVIPDELVAANFDGVFMPKQPRTLAMSSRDLDEDIWSSQNDGADEVAVSTIFAPGSPDQRTSEPVSGYPDAIHIGGPGGSQKIGPNWFESLPLFGQRILVTRTIPQAPMLSRTLRELGAEPVELPAIDIIPDPFPESTKKAAEDLPTYDWVIFTSTNAAEIFLEKLRQLGYDARRFGNARIAAIGNATAERLRRNFIEPDFIPDEFVAEAVLDGLRERGIDGARVLIPRAEIARTTLPEGLRKSGATVDVVPVYRTIPGTPDPQVIDRIDAGEVDIITFTSSSTVTNLLAMLDGDASRLASTRVACIGPITKATAIEHGLEVSVIASEYSIPGLIDALCALQVQEESNG